MGCRGPVSRPAKAAPNNGSSRPAQPNSGRTDDFLPALEGLRAIAVLAVLLHHVSFLSGLTYSSGLAGGVLARMDVGVAVFFALSGFLLYRPFARAAIQAQPKPPVRAYLWHRALRILPGYWAVAVVALTWLNIDYLRSLWDWAIPLLLVHIYEPLRLPVGLEQTWSLATEAVFYLALPLIAALGRRMGGRTPLARARRQLALGIALVLAGLVWNVIAHVPDSPLPELSWLWLPAFLDWFGIGIVLAVLASWPPSATSSPFLPDLGSDGSDPGEKDLWSGTQRGLRVLTFAPGTSWMIAGVLLWIASTPIAGPRGLEPATPVEAITEHVMFLLITWCVVAPLVGRGAGGVPRALLLQPLVRFLGRISYGIFLWHILALEVCFRLLGFTRTQSSFWVLLTVTLALTIPVAAASYHLIERPTQLLRRLLERRADNRRAGASSAVSVETPASQAVTSGPAEQPALAPRLVPSANPTGPQHEGGDSQEEQGRREHAE
ncbi:acyltransferase family protein [Micromonospora chokoriensis]|uniref:acyltransferase family protein n=1 Tax=Micromonospora chokoriensis TaxID=356851 RepID=UPI000B5ACAE5